MKTTDKNLTGFRSKYLAAAAVIGLGVAFVQPAFAVTVAAVTPAQANWIIEEVVVNATARPFIRVAQNGPASTASDATPENATPARERMRDRIRERVIERRADRPEVDRHLSTDQVRDIVAGRLAIAGNANLKVGKVTSQENNVVAVDIVTNTGALVSTREISTKTGGPARVNAQ